MPWDSTWGVTSISFGNDGTHLFPARSFGRDTGREETDSTALGSGEMVGSWLDVQCSDAGVAILTVRCGHERSGIGLTKG